MRLTDKKFWDESYDSSSFYDQSNHAIAILLQKHLDNGLGKTAIEIGSFPGSFIPTIGRKGYIVNGVDFNERNATDLPKWLNSLNLTTGDFWSIDFFDFIKTEKKKFDLVCSFGLIEHFENYNEVIRAHLSLVSSDGQVIITTPNFNGWLQKLPHRLFDNENLKKHFLPSMKPVKWKKLLEASGFVIQYYGYFGGYRFWVDQAQPRNGIENFFLRITERTISKLNKLFQIMHWESSSFSSYCGIVATKK